MSKSERESLVDPLAEALVASVSAYVRVLELGPGIDQNCALRRMVETFTEHRADLYAMIAACLPLCSPDVRTLSEAQLVASGYALDRTIGEGRA
jgi:hypothetical protein